MGLVKFVKSLTKEEYLDLSTKDQDALYFPSDENEIYLYNRKVSGDGQPLISDPLEGNLAAMDGTGQTTNSGAAISTGTPSTDSLDTEIPTSKAVYTAIENALNWG
jgi:hypothetical protein